MLGFLSFLMITLEIAWTAGSSSVQADGFKLYYGTAPGVHTASVELDNPVLASDGRTMLKQVSLPLDLSKPSYLVMRSYNTFGESDKSNEVAVGKPSAPTISRVSARE